jgi:hypothetical protein
VTDNEPDNIARGIGEKVEEKTKGSKPGRLALVLLTLGGLLMIVGPLLSYLNFEFNLTGGPASEEQLTGLDTDDGKLFLAVGVFILLVALIVAISRSTGVRRFLGLVVVVFAGLLLYVGIADIGSAEKDALAGLSEATDQQDGALPEVDPGIGLYLSTIGAAAALVGSAALLLGRGRQRDRVPGYAASWGYGDRPVVGNPISESSATEDPTAESHTTESPTVRKPMVGTAQGPHPRSPWSRPSSEPEIDATEPPEPVENPALGDMGGFRRVEKPGGEGDSREG